jgi:predicted transcriptional regulator
MIQDQVHQEFSVTIALPESILQDMKDRPKPILVKFNSQENKEIYIREEYKATESAVAKLAAAWQTEDRAKAYLNLYNARIAFSEKFLRQVLKDITPEVA